MTEINLTFQWIIMIAGGKMENKSRRFGAIKTREPDGARVSMGMGRGIIE
jgi:hypothetical protein